MICFRCQSVTGYPSIPVTLYRVASQLQVLQQVGVAGGRCAVLCRHVCDQLVGGPGYQRHRPGSVRLRQLQETR